MRAVVAIFHTILRIFFTDNTEIQKHLPEVVDNVEAETPSNGSGESSTSFLLQHIDKDCPCDEIILCDRSAGMVHSCMLKVESRLGYVPYRYPNYDVEGIRSEIESGLNCAKGNAANATAVMAVRKRKVLHGDGTIQEVLVTPLEGNELDEFLTAVSSRDGTPSEVIVPIIQGVRMGEKLELLSKSGKAEVAARAELVQMREQFRNQVQDRLRRKERQILQKRDDSGSSFSEGDWTARRGALAPPQELMDEGKTLQRQPLFSVANYAAEQLPFADNSFDTIVDTFGLCSYDDPVRALRELSRVCKPSGRILLIEHGKGTAQRVNSHLDKWAPRHAKNWGCWWNRDIRRAVRLSGLSVEKWEDKHFGTSHYIIAKPYKTMQEWEAYEQMQATKRV